MTELMASSMRSGANPRRAAPASFALASRPISGYNARSAGRRTQVAKGAVCKTAMQRFEPARRLQTAQV